MKTRIKLQIAKEFIEFATKRAHAKLNAERKSDYYETPGKIEINDNSIDMWFEEVYRYNAETIGITITSEELEMSDLSFSNLLTKLRKEASDRENTEARIRQHQEHNKKVELFNQLKQELEGN